MTRCISYGLSDDVLLGTHGIGECNIICYCRTINQFIKNTDEWSQRVIEYNISIEQRLDVKDVDLPKYLAMSERWKKLTVADEDPEFLDEYNHVISDGLVPNGEYDNKTDDEEK